MDYQLVTICLLTSFINIIGALAYSSRIAGVRTNRISLSFSLFNILVLVSRTSNGFLGPLLAKALLTVGVLASIYAGYLNPEYRVTASQLSAVVNGFATILLFTFIDPQLSQLTDDVIHGQESHSLFRRTIIWISICRFLGTILAQILFLPSAHFIAFIANYI